ARGGSVAQEVARGGVLPGNRLAGPRPARIDDLGHLASRHGCHLRASPPAVRRRPRSAIRLVNPSGCPQSWSRCLALAGSPCGLVVAAYRSNCFCPATLGGATVSAIACGSGSTSR